ncbi:MAG: thioredoxin [Puniceicoccaceae bacterium]|nr:MAG: thioredoxin [Puniceicoccaceae bacterium]
MKTLHSLQLMGTALLTIAAVLLAAGGLHASEAKPAKPEAVALIFHADWCGSCKAMEPVIKEARQELGDARALFVTLDLTNDETRRQAELLAAALGLGDIYAERGGRTGAMLVVNRATGKVVETVTREDDAAAVVRKVKAAMKS